jgi:hypothetical protein
MVMTLNLLTPAIKSEDTTQLVTLGTGFDDVFSFDPAIIHVDFLSLHVYPNWDRTIIMTRRHSSECVLA